MTLRPRAVAGESTLGARVGCVVTGILSVEAGDVSGSGSYADGWTREAGVTPGGGCEPRKLERQRNGSLLGIPGEPALLTLACGSVRLNLKAWPPEL